MNQITVIFKEDRENLILPMNPGVEVSKEDYSIVAPEELKGYRVFDIENETITNISYIGTKPTPTIPTGDMIIKVEKID